MTRLRISEHPDGTTPVTAPDDWILDEAFRPGKTWFTAACEADPEAWTTRLSTIAGDINTQLSSRRPDDMEPQSVWDAYWAWRGPAKRVHAALSARLPHAKRLRSAVRRASNGTVVDDSRSAVLLAAIVAHRDAAEDFDAEPHDIALWSHIGTSRTL